MIKSLNEIARSRDFDIQRYGDKTVWLAELISDIGEQGFRCHKPSGYGVDTGEVDEIELKDAFDGLVSEIDTSIGGRKVGAIYCRSSAPGEYPGSNESIPVLYYECAPEQSWLSFRDAFQRVREQGALKPVLLQKLIGEITYDEISIVRRLPGGKKPEDIEVGAPKKVSIDSKESETDYIIGQTNTAFVARSRDCLEPNMASVKRAWGLTSYLMGSDKESDLRPKSMIVEYFDPETGNVEETINLGHDFWQTCKPYYFQRHYEVFSVRNSELELREALVDKHPHEISREVLRIAEFYQAKLGVEIEIEGCMINGGLHILQITKSPLPEDVISHLTEVPESNILYRTDFGRGSINHSGHIVIKEDDRFRNVTDVFDEQGTPYLVLGFDEGVTSETKFLYIATNSSIKDSIQRRNVRNRGDIMRLVRMTQHMQGIACQTTFDAAQNSRQGGMFFADPDSLMDYLEGHIEEIDGVKIIPDVCVEACREGMQIYTVS